MNPTDQLVRDYLANGGTITQLPPGPMAFNDAPPPRNMWRGTKASLDARTAKAVTPPWQSKPKRVFTDEHRAKMSAGHQARKSAPNGKPHGNKGRILSDEAKAKISAANKGKKRSEEVKAKMSAAHQARKSPPAK